MKRYVFDANALIALLQDEPGAEKVADVLNSAYKGESEIIMHKANFLEVYYDAYRYRGKEQADLMWAEVKNAQFKSMIR
ncbi:MAG: PIN domain-containing protein [Defluviitaleaceae bacterium]|nr:PIN domain-containing protein [Defluviitaleaceae bacterium]